MSVLANVISKMVYSTFCNTFDIKEEKLPIRLPEHARIEDITTPASSFSTRYHNPAFYLHIDSNMDI